MASSWQPPDFAIESWYSDPTDRRCPHDASLESLEITQPASDSPTVNGDTSIKLTLLSAHRAGWLIFSYYGVRNHSLTAYSCDQGVGEWRRDEFSTSSLGLTCHRITWLCPASGTSQWLIEAAEVAYEWKPKSE